MNQEGESDDGDSDGTLVPASDLGIGSIQQHLACVDRADEKQVSGSCVALATVRATHFPEGHPSKAA